ncbi:CHAT domain-containing protein [Favolaschia claudopus]|uniref:CHAT domain-containing protein n=1 Tax=Favolaschia claudopus TaxID=2862362 RepID=A0AAW0EC80_9AGAR
MKLANAVQSRFCAQGNAVDLEEAITLHREVLELCPSPLSIHPTCLNNLGLAIRIRAEQTGSIDDFQEAINLHREALSLCPDSPLHPERTTALYYLGCALRLRFEQQGDFEYLEEAIGLHREAISLLSTGSRMSSLDGLGRAFRLRFQVQGTGNDLNDAIALHRQALALCPSSHPERDVVLINLANAIRVQFLVEGDPHDLNDAIELYRAALALCPGTHPHRAAVMNNLAGSIQTRYLKDGDCGVLDEALELYREALVLVPPPHPLRSTVLDNLANVLRTRFEVQGHFEDLEEAIKLHRASFALCPPSHPAYSAALTNLGGAVQARFQQKGDLNDLDEAIKLHTAALLLRPVGNFERSTSLNNLAGAIQSRFEQKGDIEDLDKAVELQREALALCPPLHPHHGIALNNLARAVQTRFEQIGDSQDINEVIKLHRAALELRPVPHPHRSVSLNNLARAFETRFEQQGDPTDLEEATKLTREALALCPPPHADRTSILNTLAGALQLRFEQQGRLEDLEEAISLFREALQLASPAHPDRSAYLNNLTAAVQSRFQKTKNPKDLEDMIELAKIALALVSDSHPNRSISLGLLGQSLAGKYEQGHSEDDLNAAISALQEASTYLYASPLRRLQHTQSWGSVAARLKHASALPAYKAAVPLLSQIAALHLDVVSRQRILSTLKASQLASDAAACAINHTDYAGAVELLESTRSVFWSQAIKLRTPLHSLEDAQPALASKLKELVAEFEVASFRDANYTALLGSENQKKILSLEAQGLRYKRLNDEWEQTIEAIRAFPEFAEFMKPKSIASLQQAAVAGPIVVLTTKDAASYALIVTASKPVQCVKLAVMNSSTLEFQASLARGLSRGDFDAGEFLRGSSTTRGEVDAQLQVRLLGRPEGQKSAEEVFRALLTELWRTIAKPVLNALGLKKTRKPRRLWWCPTGALTFLPLHAAGIYGKEGTECVSDYVVSSYTPTLSALLNPPRPTALSKGTPFKVTVVVQSNAPKASSEGEEFKALPKAREEYNMIKNRVPGRWLTGVGVGTAEAEVGEALGQLGDSRVVHFACHGVQDGVHPLESGLVLSDGRVRVVELMRRREEVQQMSGSGGREAAPLSLAFLSACETAKGDRRNPDEAIHLAATLVFAGFRTVVATMWTIQDEDGPKIANRFYEKLFKRDSTGEEPQAGGGYPDLTKSAEALHYAVRKLREEPGVSFRRWVPFVHYGL